MNTIHIRTQVDSETLYLPQLKHFIGKEVEIVVQEAQTAETMGGTGDWDTAARAALELRATDYDFDAWREQREVDLKMGENDLP